MSWRPREQSYCVIEAGRKRERGLGGRQERREGMEGERGGGRKRERERLGRETGREEE